MSYSESLRSITLDADSSLAGYTGVPGLPGSADPNTGNAVYRFVKVTGAHQVGRAAAVANEVVVGVCQNKPQVTGQAATVAISGVSNVIAGTAGVNSGDAIKVDANGAGVTATLPADASLVVGVALGSAVAGAMFPCLLRLSGN